MDRLLKNHLLTLGEPGSDGGTGGGGPTQPIPTDFGESPPRNPRAAIERQIAGEADSDPTPAPPTKKPVEGEGSPPAPDKPDSEKKDPTTEEAEAKRVKDAQTAYHKGQEELATAKREKAELQVKIDRVSKYVDWDKLTAWEQEQAVARLDEPVTVRDLQDLQKGLTKEPQSPEPSPSDGGDTQTPEQKAFFEAYLAKHEYLIPYAKTGEVTGVAVAIAAANPDLDLNGIGEKVAQHFKEREESVRKQIETELTQKKEALGGAGSPRASTSFPESGGDEGPVDNSPGSEVAARQERLRKQRDLL